MSNDTPFTLVIQAGGRSSRMGQDKALMSFRGQPLITRLVSRLRMGAADNPPGYKLAIVTNYPDDYRFLEVPLYADLLPGAGPLGGLLTALEVSPSPVIAVVACDMPFLNPQLLLAQWALLLNEDADVVIPRLPDGLEPLHAVYRRSACLPAVRAALGAGERKMIAWFPAVRVREMTLQEISAIDPGGLSFTNVNSPEEFTRAEQEAARREGPLSTG